MPHGNGRDKLAVVTGSSGGIGSATAKLLLDRGWFVMGLSRKPGPLKHDAFRFGSIDLGHASELLELEKDLPVILASPEFKRVGLVNNAAALGPLGYLDKASLGDIAKVLMVNTLAPTLLMNLVMRSVAQSTPIRIVNVSTGAATGAYPGIGAYSISKAALRMAGMSLASEWDAPESKSRPADAAILSYEPGLVDTDMQRVSRERPVDEFPWDMFRGFAREKLLVPPERPAAEIVEFLESNKQPHFAERRLK
jgi:benzil reductase ((S)-benzoin forming)